MSLRKIVLVLIIILVFVLFLNSKKENKNTFVFWTIQLKAPFGDNIQKNIDEFQKKHPEIEVVWVDIPISEAKKRAIASIMGNNPPDLINLNPEFSSLLAQKNVLEYFSEDETSIFNENLVENLKYKGKIYGVPFYATSSLTLLNKEKFRFCNVNLKKYDDILKLKTCKNSPVFGIALNEGDAFSKILNKYGVNKENLSDEIIKEVYELFYSMKNENLLLKDTLTVNHRESIEKYMSESASFVVAGSNFINMIKENSPAVYKNTDVFPQLTGDSGEYDVSVMNFVIPKNAKNKELAKEFIFLLSNEENQMELSKKTNVLPANKKVLNTRYFKVCSSELSEKARCIAAKQLNNPIKSDFGTKNKQEINEIINRSLEVLFLNGKEKFNSINLNKEIEELIQD